MRTATLLLCFLALGLCGCDEKDSSKSAQGTNTTSGNPLNAPADYLGAVSRAQQTAEKVADTASINQAIQTYNVDNGHFPKSLDELIQGKYLSKLPEPPYGMTFSYDATTGKVKVVKAP